MAKAGDDDEQYETLVKVQRLKAAVHYTIGHICEHCEKNLDVTFSKQFIAAVSEATYRFSQTMSRDLELFAKHAKRTTVNTDDVMLVVRKSDSLASYLRQCAEKEAATREEQGVKRKEKKKANAAKADVVPVDAEDSNL